MTPPQLPASIRYFKARFRPLGRPAFWLSVAVISGLGLLLWESVMTPDWLNSLQREPKVQTNDEARAVDEAEAEAAKANPTGLSDEELAIAADIDNVELLLSQLKPIAVKPTPAQQAQNSRQRPSSPPANANTNSSNSAGTGSQNQASNPLEAITQLTFNNALGTNLMGTATSNGTSSLNSSLAAGQSPNGAAPINPLQTALDRNQASINAPATGSNSTITAAPNQPMPDQLRPSAYGLVSPPVQAGTNPASNLYAPSVPTTPLPEAATVPAPATANLNSAPVQPTTPQYGYTTPGWNNLNSTTGTNSNYSNNSGQFNQAVPFAAPNSWPQQRLGGGRINSFSNP